MSGNELPLRQCLGKRICHVIFTEASHPPQGQVILVFDDDTWIEFYSGDRIRWAGRLYKDGVEGARAFIAEPTRRTIADIGTP